jgi:hypothetical protein
MSEDDRRARVGAFAVAAMREAIESVKAAGGGPLLPFVTLELHSGETCFGRVAMPTPEETLQVARALVKERQAEVALYAIAFTASTNGERYDFPYDPIASIHGGAHPALVVEAGDNVLEQGATMAVHVTESEPGVFEYSEGISGYSSHPNWVLAARADR